MYGFYRGSVRIMRFFFNVSDKQIFNIGFVGGMVAAAFIVGAGVCGLAAAKAFLQHGCSSVTVFERGQKKTKERKQR